LVLSKHKTDTTTQFIEASGLFKKDVNNNLLLDTHIEQIMEVFDSKANVERFTEQGHTLETPPSPAAACGRTARR
jgi:type I restriction enzyme M protein